jgi:hypothetical protein
MAEVEKRKRSRAQDIIFERMQVPEDGSPMDHPWPNDAELIPADEEWTGRVVLRGAREGRTMVLFFPDGEEVVLTPSKPGQPEAASR